MILPQPKFDGSFWTITSYVAPKRPSTFPCIANTHSHGVCMGVFKVIAGQPLFKSNLGWLVIISNYLRSGTNS